MIHLLGYETSSTENGETIQSHSIDFRPLCLDHNRALSQPSVHAVLFHSEATRFARAFWQRAGPGISSRLAQHCLQNLGNARIVPFNLIPEDSPRRSRHVAYETIRSRIAGLLDRAPTPPLRCKQTAPSDVFLYQSGMAAVYQVHQMLLAWRGGESAHVGFLYEPTLKVLETQGPGLWSYHLATEADLDQLSAQQELLSREGRPIRGIWCECPSNPLLQTVDFHRLRRLADQYDMVLIVDDSIGSFANVDMLGVADIAITSLSKAFSGKADVMAGRFVNFSMRSYSALARLTDSGQRGS